MASILTCGTMSLPVRVLEDDSSPSNGNLSDAVIFVGISLLLGMACRLASRGTRVPYTVALLVMGIGFGALEYGTHYKLGRIGNGVRRWANIDPDLLLAVFLPALLFESSFSMEVHQIKRSSDKSSFISSDTGNLFFFLTGGIVFLTLVVNGSTTQFVLHILKMDTLSEAKRSILRYTRYEMLNKALEAFDDLGDDEELGPSDWPTVKRCITSLNDADGEQTHPHSSPENDYTPDHMLLKHIRVLFLNGVQNAYWVMLNEGRIIRTTANLLMQSVDEAIDLVSHEALCDWKSLKSYLNIPNHFKFLQSSIVPQKLFRYFIVGRLESACCICASFLRAHRIARQQLHKFIGDHKIAALIIMESEQEGEEAKKFLEDVRVTFPEVLRVVKTRQVTCSVLNHLIEYVNNLEKIGVLEESEMSHLQDAVQIDLKIVQNPPLDKIPKIQDLIPANPLLGALPTTVRETLVGSTTEIMKLSGTTLYREGSKSTGILLISNGVVKWSSKVSRNKNFLHPTFSHGSTLGLYEVLAGKPYICDITTDSVVRCFFIDAEKIHSVLSYDTTVEDFLWKESLTVLAKLMLPHMFEEMEMQDLRTLVDERSMMNIYNKGESFELHHQSVGFLLEGFLRVLGGQDELVPSPAAISPRVDQRFHQSETSGSCHFRSSLYQVEARARVIILDIAGYEGSRALQGSRATRAELSRHEDEHIVRIIDS